MISSGSIEPELQLTLASPSGRWVLAAAVLGSAMASLDATVVNVALPAIGRDLQASFEGLQWVITGYTLTLASFILVGGALGDRFGRRRVFTVGTVWFAGASTICALAPSTETLVAARAFQGIGAALLTPGSLAMIQASFTEQGRGKAIGAWSAFGGAATAIGPFLGGYLVQGPGWRWVFLINVPVAAIIVAIAGRHVPESRDPHAPAHLDLSGAALGALGMAGVIYALIGTSGGASITTFITLLVGIAFLAAFVVNERRSPNAMIPSSMLQYRQFNAANIVTFALYAALSGLFFLLAIDLQVVAGFSPVMAGTALLPITGIMLVLSSPVGDLATRTGPRLPMSLGPLIAACGVLLLLRIGPNASYVADVLPAVTVFGFGIALLVAPLTIAVLGAVPAEHRRRRLGNEQCRSSHRRGAGRSGSAADCRDFGRRLPGPACLRGRVPHCLVRQRRVVGGEQPYRCVVDSRSASFHGRAPSETVLRDRRATAATRADSDCGHDFSLAL